MPGLWQMSGLSALRPPPDDRVNLSQVTTYQCGIIRGDISLLTCLCANSSGGTIVPQDTATQTEIKVFYNKTTQASVAVKRTLLWLLPVSSVWWLSWCLSMQWQTSEIKCRLICQFDKYLCCPPPIWGYFDLEINFLFLCMLNEFFFFIILVKALRFPHVALLWN